jgi:CheY-like chemotaxis protein
VIDDDDLVRDGLCSLLEHLGHRTKAYRYPEVALQELIAAGTPPEVVIVDYNMPGMNGAQFIGGYSTAVAKDARFEHTSILLMSGLPPSHFHDFLSEFSHLKVGILEKPFSLETLRRKLSNIQGQRKLSGGLSQIKPKIVPPPDATVSSASRLGSASEPLPVDAPALSSAGSSFAPQAPLGVNEPNASRPLPSPMIRRGSTGS